MSYGLNSYPFKIGAAFRSFAFFVLACSLPPHVSYAQEPPPPSPLSAPAQPFIWEDFELGNTYWGTQFEASVMDGGIISPDFPTSGRYGYRGHFILSKGVEGLPFPLPRWGT